MTDMTDAARNDRFDVVVVEQTVIFSFPELCLACRASDAQLRELVDEGILNPVGRGPLDWVFEGAALRTARTALRLAREFALDVAALALVMDLLARIESLEARVDSAAGATDAPAR